MLGGVGGVAAGGFDMKGDGWAENDGGGVLNDGGGGWAV